MADRNKFPFPPPLDTRWQQVTQFPVAELNLSLDDQEDEWTEEVGPILTRLMFFFVYDGHQKS